MEQERHPSDPETARAAFNMLALHLAGYTDDQIELFHPSDMTPDRLHNLLERKRGKILRELAKEHTKLMPLGGTDITPQGE